MTLQDGGRTVSVQSLSENAISMLLLLGMHAYHDPQLLTQLARIFRHMTLSNSTLFASSTTIKEAHERASMVSIIIAVMGMPQYCVQGHELHAYRDCIPDDAAFSLRSWGLAP